MKPQHIAEILPSAIRAAMKDSPHRRRLEKLAEKLKEDFERKTTKQNRRRRVPRHSKTS